jgi:kynurenine formamidase
LKNRDYLISVDDILQWEERNGKIEDSVIVLFRTGYGKFYPDRKNYFGTDELGQEAIPGLHFPGISKEACQWLVDSKVIKAVGIDTPSLDYGQSIDFLAHRILLGNNIPGFENVANLHLLPETGAYIVALPMKIGKGSGAPLRIIANILQPEN